MPNIGREMAAFPKPSLKWGENLASESLKSLPGVKQTGMLRKMLNNQLPAGSIPGGKMKKLAMDFFFDKISAAIPQSFATKSPPVAGAGGSGNQMPGTRQFMDYASGGEPQKTIIQNPIQRTMDNAGNPQ